MQQAKKRIAILADFPWAFFTAGATGRGGGQACTWLSQIAEEFAGGNDYEIHWVSLERGPIFGKVERREWGGQFFHRIPGGKLRVDLMLGYRPSRWLLMRELKRIRPDLVHCWGTERSYPVVCSSVDVPTVLSMQGVLTEYHRVGSFSGNSLWEKMVEREPGFLEAATVVTAESQWGVDKVRGVCPGVDVRQVEYGVHPSFYELEWEPDVTAPYAIYSGSIDSRKGVDLLLEAVEAVENRNWQLKIAGEGPLQEQLEARGVPGVEWLGLLDWNGMQRELSRATCLVLPTKADTSPNVSKEARVVGLPVITSKHGGQSGYIHHGENGIIVDPLEPSGLAAALDEMMSDPQRARRMGKACHDEDRAYFRASETARKFLEIYDELIGRPGHPGGRQSS